MGPPPPRGSTVGVQQMTNQRSAMGTAPARREGSRHDGFGCRRALIACASQRGCGCEHRSRRPAQQCRAAPLEVHPPEPRADLPPPQDPRHLCTRGPSVLGGSGVPIRCSAPSTRFHPHRMPRATVLPTLPSRAWSSHAPPRVSLPAEVAMDPHWDRRGRRQRQCR